MPILHRTAEQIPGARFESIRYTGHLPQLERPESVNRHIAAFLEERRRSWRSEHEDVG
jgi:pimeloyl-ACP methyl ester carboxylesterase